MPTIIIPPLSSFRVKFTIQQKTTTQDEYGHQTSAWTDVANPIWGALTDNVRGQILIVVDQVQPTQRFTITVRYRPNITKAMRFMELSTGRLFRIIDINNIDHRNQWLQFVVTEFA